MLDKKNSFMEYKVINWSENKFVVNALHMFYSQNKIISLLIKVL